MGVACDDGSADTGPLFISFCFLSLLSLLIFCLLFFLRSSLKQTGPGSGKSGGATGARRFHTFCKVGSGYNLEVLEKMRAHFKPHLQEWKAGNLPPHYARCKAFPSGWWPAKKDDVPDLWLPAEHSLILEVMGSSITDTDQFRCVSSSFGQYPPHVPHYPLMSFPTLRDPCSSSHLRRFHMPRSLPAPRVSPCLVRKCACVSHGSSRCATTKTGTSARRYKVRRSFLLFVVISFVCLLFLSHSLLLFQPTRGPRAGAAWGRGGGGAAPRRSAWPAAHRAQRAHCGAPSRQGREG